MVLAADQVAVLRRVSLSLVPSGHRRGLSLALVEVAMEELGRPLYIQEVDQEVETRSQKSLSVQILAAWKQQAVVEVPPQCRPVYHRLLDAAVVLVVLASENVRTVGQVENHQDWKVRLL